MQDIEALNGPRCTRFWEILTTKVSTSLVPKMVVHLRQTHTVNKY
jgi:hypothetical protein